MWLFYLAQWVLKYAPTPPWDPVALGRKILTSYTPRKKNKKLSYVGVELRFSLLLALECLYGDTNL